MNMLFPIGGLFFLVALLSRKKGKHSEIVKAIESGHPEKIDEAANAAFKSGNKKLAQELRNEANKKRRQQGEIPKAYPVEGPKADNQIENEHPAHQQERFYDYREPKKVKVTKEKAK